VYSNAFGDDKAFGFSSMVEPSALMQEQLRISQDQLRHRTPPTTKKEHVCDNAALPKTLKDVLRMKSRAIVVTETKKPFRVVDVNECWEGLCGYSFSEARGKTLGSLLQGPETNQVAATGLVSHLLAGEEAGAVLINYTKDGRQFKNRIRVGPIFDEVNGTTITHFVGVLEELKEQTM
jgi:PAS domain S-box-containing protein